MKQQIRNGICLAALFCIGSAAIAGTQTNRTGGRTFIPNSGLGGQIISTPLGGLGNGFAQMTGQAMPNAANGFNPFAGLMGASGFGSSFPNVIGGFASGNGLGNGGYYGGYYGFGDPTFAVTPNGLVPLGYGYNGYTGSGTSSDSGVLRSAYAQGYEDAANQAALNDAPNSAPSNRTGLTAAPRGAIARVPHGSDGAKVWRVGNGQVAVRWQGDSRIASSVTVSVTDRAGRALRSTTLTQLPAEVHFTPPSNAVFYQVVVRYVDGAKNTIMGSLPK